VAINAKVLCEETARDSVLSRALYFTFHGWPDQQNLKSDYRQCHELTVEDGCLLRGTRVVIPTLGRYIDRDVSINIAFDISVDTSADMSVKPRPICRRTVNRYVGRDVDRHIGRGVRKLHMIPSKGGCRSTLSRAIIIKSGEERLTSPDTEKQASRKWFSSDNTETTHKCNFCATCIRQHYSSKTDNLYYLAFFTSFKQLTFYFNHLFDITTVLAH